MQFIRNDDYPRQGTLTTAVDYRDNLGGFRRPEVTQCFRHAATVITLRGDERVDPHVIVPYRVREDSDDDDSVGGNGSREPTGKRRAESSHAYRLEVSMKEAIYGQVWSGTVLESVTRANGQKVWAETNRRCAVKELDLHRIVRDQGSAENPIKEVSAMQFLRDYVSGATNTNASNMHQRAEELMIESNVMMPFEVLTENQNIYSIMPFCDGAELFDFLETRNSFPEDEARYLFNETLNGIETLQRAGICHRDISLENMMVDKQGRGLVIDLGMCIKIQYDGNGDRYLFEADRPCGKPYYMAPEIIHSQGPFDGHAVDIWATGPMLFLMVAGFPPWETASDEDDRFRVFSRGGFIRTMEQWNLGFSPDLVDLLQRMFFLDPRDRLCLQQIRAHPWMTAGPMTPPP